MNTKQLIPPASEAPTLPYVFTPSAPTVRAEMVRYGELSYSEYMKFIERKDDGRDERLTVRA